MQIAGPRCRERPPRRPGLALGACGAPQPAFPGEPLPARPIVRTHRPARAPPPPAPPRRRGPAPGAHCTLGAWPRPPWPSPVSALRQAQRSQYCRAERAVGGTARADAPRPAPGGHERRRFGGLTQAAAVWRRRGGAAAAAPLGGGRGGGGNAAAPACYPATGLSAPPAGRAPYLRPGAGITSAPLPCPGPAPPADSGAPPGARAHAREACSWCERCGCGGASRRRGGRWSKSAGGSPTTTTPGVRGVGAEMHTPPRRRVQGRGAPELRHCPPCPRAAAAWSPPSRAHAPPVCTARFPPPRRVLGWLQWAV